MALLTRQFLALFRKNWIVLLKHPFLNLFRCVVLPVAIGILLAFTPRFFSRPQIFGLGTPVPVSDLKDVFTGKRALVWVDSTNQTGILKSKDIVSHVTKGFNAAQLRAVKELSNASEIAAACPPRKCFAALAFDSFPAFLDDTVRPLNYTISTSFGGGAGFVDVQNHDLWAETSLLPLQSAVEQAVIELTTGVQVPTPLEWPFTAPPEEDYAKTGRLVLIDLIRSFLIFGFAAAYVGVGFHLAGSVAFERATHLTSHMRAMGLSAWADILSWHASLSIAYLPGWITVSLLWAYLIFKETNPGLIFVIHLLTGLGLASWAFFIAVIFGRSPPLAAIVTLVGGLALTVIAMSAIKIIRTAAAAILSLLFPPMFYAFAMRAVCGYELQGLGANVIRRDPKDHLLLLPLIFMAIINIFLWPYLSVVFERFLYNTRSNKGFWSFFSKRGTFTPAPIPENAVVSIKHLKKTYRTFRLRNMKLQSVDAIADLSMDITKGGVFALLGPNGAGKSTTLDIIGGMTRPSGGSITFEGGLERPSHGTIGIVPQKNVLFSELSCLQTLQVWKDIKRSTSSPVDEDLEQLLRDCDLADRIHSTSGSLSGGQKRKLQLAIGLVGGSKIVLVDECTSGVDPISRRALWKTLTSHRGERTIILTTHFLDEADLLADEVVVLATGGKLVAEGSPVELKSKLGEGYTVQVSFVPGTPDLYAAENDLLGRIRLVSPEAYMTRPSTSKASYHLKTNDLAAVGNILQTIDSQQGDLRIDSYDVSGTSIEEIFLELIDEEKRVKDAGEEHQSTSSVSFPALTLPNGRPRSPLAQALTIFHKRVLVFRRSFIAPVMAFVIVILLTYFPLRYLLKGIGSCIRTEESSFPPFPLFMPLTSEYIFTGPVLLSPPNVTSILNVTTTSPDFGIPQGANQPLYRNLPDNATFVSEIRSQFANISFGGLSVNLETWEALIGWNALTPFDGAELLSVANNIFYNHALNTTTTPRFIYGHFGTIPDNDNDNLFALEWVVVIAVAMILYPAFATLYVARERRSSVQAMQASNGLSNPIGLWLGHLVFDSILSPIVAAVFVAFFNHIRGRGLGLGLLWLIAFLYTVAATLLSYCAAVLTGSPIGAFALVVTYQLVLFILGILPYILTTTQAIIERASLILNACHFTISLLAPIVSLIRACFVANNLFRLDCDRTNVVHGSALSIITRYGGPILYLILQACAFLAILVWADSGSLGPWRRLFRRKYVDDREKIHDDVAAEAKEVSSSNDVLRVLGVSKSYDGSRVVDDVSFGVSRDTIFAMLGPNGAGKTTTLDILRGSITPDSGDVMIDGTSVMRHPGIARSSLGVCPQFTTIDSQLTTREHLWIYGRLKGLYRGKELDSSVDSLLQATGLDQYDNLLASRLSGGNQRKLSLAIALIGNPAVVLIDEFSTGVDAAVKRELWKLIKELAPGKAFVITTHSMEEASSLATKVGILWKRMLAVGSPSELAGRYSTYTVHFTCRTTSDRIKIQNLMAQIPGSKMALDLSTRFDVPIVPTRRGTTRNSSDEKVLSLAALFHLLAQQTDLPDFTVETSGLEATFIRIIRENEALNAQSAEQSSAV
ncbi:putative ABC-2 family transporter protein [Lyophyllum shimeji]|uniref:ABC-2 family transporter protein n=1 Tax=Lyophyllum shimeji TaxID=47721 RepID=A0A9P3PZH9_LYOSH|nr:putative ABC-2 family transporter protein [Lyophyllum shimeji]